MTPDQIKRFEAKFSKTEGCWLWTAAISSEGYGILTLNRIHQKAHRVSYELYVGPIPKGLQIDHLCGIRNCVNPSHLQAVTQLENIQRGEGDYNKLKTHCPRNHEYTVENTYSGPYGRRGCRKCRKIASQKYEQKRIK